jgi:hypothetical protein
MDEDVIERVPAWLQARYIAVAAELERMHGAAFADEFLVGVMQAHPHSGYFLRLEPAIDQVST